MYKVTSLLQLIQAHRAGIKPREVFKYAMSQSFCRSHDLPILIAAWALVILVMSGGFQEFPMLMIDSLSAYGIPPSSEWVLLQLICDPYLVQTKLHPGALQGSPEVSPHKFETSHGTHTSPITSSVSRAAQKEELFATRSDMLEAVNQHA